MPQMAPISWLMLFITFSIAFLMFNFMNYFSTTPPAAPQSKSTKYYPPTPTWKW